MDHIAVHLICEEDVAETISFLLQELNYAGTSYEDGRLIAYCPKDTFNEEQLLEVLAPFGLKPESTVDEPDQNWNELWEKNFKDLEHDGIHIRAPFHKAKALEHEIIIHPKRAFGTGHHGSTQLMLSALKQIEVKDKKVLDMGCGSGILAIFASKLNASEVLAIDYDPNSLENCTENVQLNGRNNVRIMQAEDLSAIDEVFDIILSNIIKSVNLDLLPSYVDHVSEGGYILLAGLLSEDEVDIKAAAQALHLQYISTGRMENWIQLTFKKP
ncbi:50S ribosomal protein L11 methyltransferase [bacterium]|nr:50S ribosomal protein L11 methyltransferase [bacterium]